MCGHGHHTETPLGTRYYVTRTWTGGGTWGCALTILPGCASAQIDSDPTLVPGKHILLDFYRQNPALSLILMPKQLHCFRRAPSEASKANTMVCIHSSFVTASSEISVHELLNLAVEWAPSEPLIGDPTWQSSTGEWLAHHSATHEPQRWSPLNKR